MRVFLPSLAACAGAVSALSGCTVIVVNDVLADQSACADPGDCAAGYACQDGLCALVDDDVAPPPAGTVVGAAGGDVSGPDGVTLSVPAGALAADAPFVIERASATHVALGCDEVSDFYRVSPDLDLAVAAVLAIPVDSCDACAVCAEPDEGGAWTVLDAPGVAPSGTAAALLLRTGAVVVAGVPQ
jgi:hypothetical protein